ncbi:MAG: hypothetical protein Kow0077_02890 [Anaerolineae bacterium]
MRAHYSGWQLHPVCDATAEPYRFKVLLVDVSGQVRQVARSRKNVQKVAALIREHRSMIETVNSQLEKVGHQRLRARTSEGIV